MSTLLSQEEIDTMIRKVPEWEVEGKSLTRHVEFDGFMDAIDFVNDIAEVAEEAMHHPDIDIRLDKVILGLMTHDKGGITEMDFEMASRLDTLID